MKNQGKLHESEQSRKLMFIRRIAMLAVLGLFVWQLSGDLAVSASNGRGSEEVACCCGGRDIGFMVRGFAHIFFDGDVVRLENALLFGQAPCR